MEKILKNNAAIRSPAILNDAVIDGNLPTWARRSNPIVRRELGASWKAIVPNTTFLFRVVSVQAILVMLMPLSALMTLVMPTAVFSTVGAPVVFFLYVRLLLTVVNASATSMSRAYNQNTIDLLRVSPLATRDIVLGKVAASIWRRMDDLDVVLILLSFFSLPYLTAQHFATISSGEFALLSRVAVAAGLFVMPTRVVLELFMLGCCGVLAGLLLKSRATSVTAVLSGAVFYFAVLTIPRFAALPWALRFTIESVLPIAVPLTVSWLALRRIHHYLEMT